MKQSVPTRRSSSLAAAKRPGSRRSGRIPATAGAFALALGLTPAVAPEAAAQSNSGIYIHNDVLNSLGPGPEAAPFAPLAPAAPPTPLSPSDRTSVVSGTRVSVSVDLGGRRSLQNK